MLDQIRISFIGGGNMAEAMIKGLVNKNLVDASNMMVSDPLTDRLRDLEQRYQLKTTTDNRLTAQAGDIVVLSIKPQVLSQVLPELHGTVQDKSFVLSIMAGVPIEQICEGLHHRQIVRVMPNTPAMIGQGMSVWTTTPEVSESQRKQAQLILQTLGEEVEVQDEDHIDMATALNGSGPAYVFVFMEALIDAGVHMGFSRPVSQKIVLQTLQGSIALAKQSMTHPAELRNMVTSPAGTTAEALYQLEKGGFRTVLSKAVWAAYQKSKHLGGLNSQ
jgi:pyrroline-5-carboxylate reductase